MKKIPFLSTCLAFLFSIQALAIAVPHSDSQISTSNTPKNSKSIHILDPRKEDSINGNLSTSCSRNITAENIRYVDNEPPENYRARLPNNTLTQRGDEDNDHDQTGHPNKRNSNEELTLLEVRGGWDCGGRKHSMKAVLGEFAEATNRWDQHISTYSFESNNYPMLYDPYIRLPGLSTAKTKDFANGSFVPLLHAADADASETQKSLCANNYMYLWPLPQECSPAWEAGAMEPKDFVVFGATSRFVDTPYRASKKGKVSKKLGTKMRESEKAFLAPCSVVTRKTHWHKAASWEEYTGCRRFEENEGIEANKVEGPHPDGIYLTYVEGPP